MLNQTHIKMDGQDMELTLTRHAHDRIMQRSFLNPDDEFFQLAFLLERDDVADYLLNDVRVGEDCVIIDEDNGVSYALNMGTDSVEVKTVFYMQDSCKNRTIRASKNQFAVLIKNAQVVAASLFCDVNPIAALG